MNPAHSGAAVGRESRPLVRMLPWPLDEGQAADRRRWQRLGEPCLFVVAAEAAPPHPCTLLEDWVRLPLDPVEVEVRRRTLVRRRASLGTDTRSGQQLRCQPLRSAAAPDDLGDPVIDLSGVRLTARERAAVALLLEHRARPVARAAVQARFRAGGGTRGEGAFNAFLSRLRRKVEAHGLVIHTLSGHRLQASVEARPGAATRNDGAVGGAGAEPRVVRRVHTQNNVAKHP